jgi:hypothetical protein
MSTAKMLSKRSKCNSNAIQEEEELCSTPESKRNPITGGSLETTDLTLTTKC